MSMHTIVPFWVPGFNIERRGTRRGHGHPQPFTRFEVYLRPSFKKTFVYLENKLLKMVTPKPLTCFVVDLMKPVKNVLKMWHLISPLRCGRSATGHRVRSCKGSPGKGQTTWCVGPSVLFSFEVNEFLGEQREIPWQIRRKDRRTGKSWSVLEESCLFQLLPNLEESCLFQFLLNLEESCLWHDFPNRPLYQVARPLCPSERPDPLFGYCCCGRCCWWCCWYCWRLCGGPGLFHFALTLPLGKPIVPQDGGAC